MLKLVSLSELKIFCLILQYMRMRMAMMKMKLLMNTQMLRKIWELVSFKKSKISYSIILIVMMRTTKHMKKKKVKMENGRVKMMMM